MAKPFTSYTFDDAVELIGTKLPASPTLATRLISQNARRPTSAVAATDFFNGNHWQLGNGFIGQLPPTSLPGSQQIKKDIESGFVSENVIQEVTETHVGGILGREPLWSFLPEQEPGSDEKPEKDKKLGAMVTPWWNEREALKDLQKSAETVVLEGIAIRRIFFPKGRVPEDGILTAPDLSQALDYIYFQNLYSDSAGVFTDPDTQKQIGIYLFEEKDDQGNVTANAAELSFLNVNGETVCRVVRDKGGDTEYGPYKLGGRLLIHELKRRPLITEQVQSNQRALNLAHTMMMRNVNLAGSRERTVVNAQDPMRPRTIQDPDNVRQTRQLEPAPWELGAGAVMSLVGFPIRNEKGEIVGYTNPNVSISDPAPVDTFVKTSDHYRAAIYSQCHQRHVLIVDKAESSGRAREQARAEFERSLKETKAIIDAAGRWQLETSLRLAAQLCNQTNKYLNLRADFNCLIDSGDVDPEKVAMVITMRMPGGPNNQPLISDERARQLCSVEDPAAELAKIEEEAPSDEEIKKRIQLTQPPTKVNGQSDAVN